MHTHTHIYIQQEYIQVKFTGKLILLCSITLSKIQCSFVIFAIFKVTDHK